MCRWCSLIVVPLVLMCSTTGVGSDLMDLIGLTRPRLIDGLVCGWIVDPVSIRVLSDPDPDPLDVDGVQVPDRIIGCLMDNRINPDLIGSWMVVWIIRSTDYIPSSDPDGADYPDPDLTDWISWVFR